MSTPLCHDDTCDTMKICNNPIGCYTNRHRQIGNGHSAAIRLSLDLHVDQCGNYLLLFWPFCMLDMTV